MLAPGGRLHLLDIDGSPPSPAGRLLRLGHVTPPSTGTGRARTGTSRACTRTPNPTLRSPRCAKAGLTDAAVVAHGAMPMGGYSYYRAAR